MRRALAPVVLGALLVAGCGRAAVPHRIWVTQVCQALSPWRDRLTALNGQAAQQMKTAKTPAQTREHLLRLLDGARQASEDARAKVAGAGDPDVPDGAAIEHRFVDALAAVRDAYGRAQQTVQQLPEPGFYDGVQRAMDTLNKDYAQAGLEPAKLASAELHRDFEEVPACG
jgi:hypothetical protein